jgi:DNA-binding transcriptional LysR family regulator
MRLEMLPAHKVARLDVCDHPKYRYTSIRRIRTMNIDSLRCFVAACEAPTFRQAARLVRLSPGAFSDRIRRLEDDVGGVLFHRSSRRVSLSPGGERLLPHARQLLQMSDRCAAIVQGQQGPTPFEITIGTRYELGLSWLEPSLEQLQTNRPHRTVHLYMSDAPALMRALSRRDVDAVISSARLQAPKLRYATLHREHYAFVGGPSIRCSGPDDALGLSLLDISPALPLFRYLLDALDDGTPWRFARQHYLGGIGAMRARLLASGGVAVMPVYFVDADLKAGRLVRLLPEVAMPHDAFRLVWLRDHPRDQGLQALADELREIPLA